jgi:hypothetical protein
MRNYAADRDTPASSPAPVGSAFAKPLSFGAFYPGSEPAFDLSFPIRVRRNLGGSSAQQSGAPHNDEAAKSQYLVFLSRRCD